MNENDFESPGYEYLRSYQNMNSLYYKLLILNYQQDFCSIYRCPPIHKYYFSMPNKNQSEQQFLFTCLCAWLIKDKCQMNLELEPEEYEDRDTTLSVIVEALRLLLTPDEEMNAKKNSKNLIGFSPARLKSGFGPEVVWTINILADRALELLAESGPKRSSNQIIYHNASADVVDPERAAVHTSITIGQPFVGGGLSTRPLGSYQVDDANLLLEDDSQNLRLQSQTPTNDSNSSDLDRNAWFRRVERATPSLNAANLMKDESIETKDWQNFLKSTRKCATAIDVFLQDSRCLLEPILNKVDDQLKIINERESFIQAKLKVEIEEFLKNWRAYSLELTRNTDLLEQINSRTDKFDQYNEKLRRLNNQIELRISELNDGSRLRELEVMKNRLRKENDEFDIKIGLLLTVYAKKQRKIIAETSDRQNQ